MSLTDLPTDEQDYREGMLAGAAADAAAGVRESPAGSNRGPRVDVMIASCGLLPPAPWCACACNCWAQETAQRLKLRRPFRVSASVTQIYHEAFPLGRIKPAARARRGDLLLLGKFSGPSQFTGHHVGIVEHNFGDGFLHTVEGNTNDNGSADGEAVLRQKRKLGPGMVAVDIARGVVPA